MMQSRFYRDYLDDEEFLRFVGLGRPYWLGYSIQTPFGEMTRILGRNDFHLSVEDTIAVRWAPLAHVGKKRPQQLTKRTRVIMSEQQESGRLLHQISLGRKNLALRR